VIITSCIGAYQLSVRKQQQQQDTNANNNKNAIYTNGIDNNKYNKEDNNTLRSQSQARRPVFPLVVVDEAAQCTDPGLVCALVASQHRASVLSG